MKAAPHENQSAVSGFLRVFFEPEILAWRGRRSLATVFWGYGVFASSALGAFYAVSIYGGSIALQQVLLLGFAAYTVWLLVSLWRCSAPAQHPLWGVLVRQLVVVWALNAIFVLSFLQIDLAERALNAPHVMQDSRPQHIR